MSISEDFKSFLENTKIENATTIALRYGEATAALNKLYRDTESKTANSLQVGSYGRWTAITGISDLDMIYILPAAKWESYKSGGQYKLLCDTKDAIKKRYPSTTVKVDRLVVRVLYNDFHIEVMPAFKQPDDSFKYPDTAASGSWKITKPIPELNEIKEANKRKNGNLRNLCKIVRAWKNKHGVVMGGLLIDTLAYNFLESTDEYDSKSFHYYDCMCRDFFKFLADQPKQSEYAALGSKQRVRVKQRFERKAKKAHDLCIKAIKASGQKNERQKWRDVLGNGYPAPETSTANTQSSVSVFRKTEEFIEGSFNIDIRCNLEINCEVTQNGFRKEMLRNIVSSHGVLLPNKQLRFFIADTSDLPTDVNVYWKVLNRGEIAKRRDCIRGQITRDCGLRECKESTSFQGSHLVECYIEQRGVIIARDSILVPINTRNLKDQHAA